MVLNVVAMRRSSGGPESTMARLVRSPSASLPAAPSSLASGLLTQRTSANASSVAPIRATTPIVARMAHSATMARFSDAEDLARITVPTSTRGAVHRRSRDHPRSRGLGDRLDRMPRLGRGPARLSACWASCIQLPAGMVPSDGGLPGPAASGFTCSALQDQQAVTGPLRLAEEGDQRGMAVLALGDGSRRAWATAASVRAMPSVSWVNEFRSCAIVFSASGTIAPAMIDGGEGQQDQQDPPGHGALP